MHPWDWGVPSCARVWRGSPSLVGMEWKPMAACCPWAKRTKYSITPESSMPTAHRERDQTA